MSFQSFDPPEEVRKFRDADFARHQEIIEALPRASLEKLRALNTYWFAQQTGVKKTILILWLVNNEFTRRGVAPGWRRAPPFVKEVQPPPQGNPSSTAPRSLGHDLRRKLMLRWIDLEWLRKDLGPTHIPQMKQWRGVFSTDDQTAWAAFRKVNAVQSKGGSSFGTETPWKVLFGLSVPKFDRRALEGLIDRDSGELRTSTRKRVLERYRPLLDALRKRPKYPLTAEQVEKRLLYCEAIDLAQGNLVDAARAMKWISGEVVTRQSMNEMRTKIAEQCGLATRAWVTKAK